MSDGIVLVVNNRILHKERDCRKQELRKSKYEADHTDPLTSQFNNHASIRKIRVCTRK